MGVSKNSNLLHVLIYEFRYKMSERKARHGICLFINNDPNGAEAFFNEPSEDVEMRAGKCFISLINALLSYDPERFAEAEAALRALEADCMEEVGWVESMKNSVFGSSVSLAVSCWICFVLFNFCYFN